ncbi:hypothetical protein IHQ71_05780 [Rhizobium sp. TH2]|uniref:hypothetical protein n=1 Tax=Rhizobium sp. TH2 TaxID=2775403 RepID=UPI002157C38A|nr:hypothetical protein [Rhizobium sp. TH2]UVC10115.1 hypothetical protein IHQ71_05780 [Rhizobium sp. TH2]
MSGKFLRTVASFGLLAGLAACSATDTGGMFSSVKKSDTAGNDPKMVVMQGACPQVYLREGTAVYTQYAKGVKKNVQGLADPNKLVIQATLDATTRQCRQTDQGLVVTVVVRGRVITGPEGKDGTYSLPIRVAATDGDQTLYSELTPFQVTIPPGQGNAQFIFTKENVVLSAPASGLTRLFAGIDEGPYNTK